jgi:hypothetical protein
VSLGVGILAAQRLDVALAALPVPRHAHDHIEASLAPRVDLAQQKTEVTDLLVSFVRFPCPETTGQRAVRWGTDLRRRRRLEKRCAGRDPPVAPAQRPVRVSSRTELRGTQATGEREVSETATTASRAQSPPAEQARSGGADLSIGQRGIHRSVRGRELRRAAPLRLAVSLGSAPRRAAPRRETAVTAAWSACRWPPSVQVARSAEAPGHGGVPGAGWPGPPSVSRMPGSGPPSVSIPRPRASAPGCGTPHPRRAVQRHDPESDFLFRAMSTAYSSGASPFLLGGSVSPVASGSSRGVPVAARWQIILRRVEQRGADICDVDHPDQACFADHR